MVKQFMVNMEIKESRDTLVLLDIQALLVSKE